MSKVNTLPKHLCIRPLTVYDVQQSLDLETDAFPEEERATLEKIKYRLTVCPELSSGLFVREFEDSNDEDDDPDETKEYNPPDHSTIVKETLIGQVMGTKIYDDCILDRSMEIPVLTEEMLPDVSIPDNDKVGHVESSRIIGVHSVIIHSKYRGLKLGSLLVKDYIQKLSQQDVGDKIVIIAHDYLIPFYSSLGFESRGESQCRFGNQTWYDLYVTLTHDEDEED